MPGYPPRHVCVAERRLLLTYLLRRPLNSCSVPLRVGRVPRGGVAFPACRKYNMFDPRRRVVAHHVRRRVRGSRTPVTASGVGEPPRDHSTFDSNSVYHTRDLTRYCIDVIAIPSHRHTTSDGASPKSPPLLQSWAPFVTLKAWESRGTCFDIAIPARHCKRHLCFRVRGLFSLSHPVL